MKTTIKKAEKINDKVMTKKELTGLLIISFLGTLIPLSIGLIMHFYFK